MSRYRVTRESHVQPGQERRWYVYEWPSRRFIRYAEDWLHAMRIAAYLNFGTPKGGSL